MQKTLPNGKWRKRLKIKALPPFAELHKVRAGNYKMFSLKTLLASLLGCTFVVIKAMTFERLSDIVWILSIGYLSVKGLTTAFSQEAYDCLLYTSDAADD